MENKIKIGDRVIMPEPTADDIWLYGNFEGLVNDILDNGNLIVEDADSDCWEIEPHRVEKV